MTPEAKQALDKIIRKGRVHFYKPIQVAEILHYHRLALAEIDLANLSTYRNASKHWRDAVSLRLVGRVSTSSQKYQDNLFEGNAIPPHFLQALAIDNQNPPGLVESYIYHRFEERLQDVLTAYQYLTTETTDDFNLDTFLAYFEYRPGLKRSIDKAFEIVVYALFSALVKALQAEVSLTLKNPDPQILQDFSGFVSQVLGLSPEIGQSINVPASLYRAGVTNAADSGLDILTNYGPAIQVKHLNLDVSLADEILERGAANEMIIVCKTAEAKIIQSLLNQVGVAVRGIITQQDLSDWYKLCQTKYIAEIGKDLLQNLAIEFTQEFPILDQLPIFLNERGYDKSQLRPPYILA
jgi:type II restriction enzyme